jgi:hypothetical protein
MKSVPIYGLLGEFEQPDDLLQAVRRARSAGYRRINAYTPFPIEGLAEELGFRRTYLPALVLLGGVIGCAGGFALQYWISVIDYPLNIGGRPLNSWPAFIPVTFETTILTAALFAVLGMLGLNGLPRPFNPLFNAPRFALATRNRFFLFIEAADRQFDREATTKFMHDLNPQGVTLVEDV